MRRADREIKEYDEIVKVISECDVCRIALNDGDFPYIVPLNFGMKENNGTIELYFHCARDGKKLDLIRKNGNASFEMDCGHELIINDEKMNCTMAYESVIGTGIIEILPDEKTAEALDILMKHYHREDFPINEKTLSITSALKLTVSTITGKRRVKK